ncbi:3D domain-containing protein [Alicyclobacillus mengziensis]|nr:3D domain-containing protein [Alicyclobacillus mengziensis]
MQIPKSKVLYMMVGAVLAVFGGSGFVARSAYKTVTVTTHGQRQVLRGFTFGSLGSFLASKQIPVNQRDRVSPDLSTPVHDGMKVVIQAPKFVTLIDGNSRATLQTFAPTVMDFLNQQGIQIGPKTRVSVPLSSPLQDGEQVTVHYYETSTSVKTEVLQFQTIRRTTNKLYVGQQRVLTHGVKGSKEIKTTTVLRDGKAIQQSTTTKIVKPVNEVVEVGTKQHPQHLSARGFSSFVILKQLTVVATAYMAGGTTATGVPAEPGVIAVDPSVIPLGTKLYIPGIGIVTADDTGAAIRGNRIDICMASQGLASNWGERVITIYEVR